MGSCAEYLRKRRPGEAMPINTVAAIHPPGPCRAPDIMTSIIPTLQMRAEGMREGQYLAKSPTAMTEQNADLTIGLSGSQVSSLSTGLGVRRGPSVGSLRMDAGSQTRVSG